MPFFQGISDIQHGWNETLGGWWDEGVGTARVTTEALLGGNGGYDAVDQMERGDDEASMGEERMGKGFWELFGGLF